MKMRKTTTCVALLLACVGPAAVAGVADIQIGKPLTTAAEAKQAADNWTGLNTFYVDKVRADSAVKAEAVTYDEPISPFLYAELKGRSAWKVTYRNVELVLDSATLRADQRRYWLGEVWLDSATSQLMLVRLRPADTPSVEFRMPTPEETEQQLANATEVYGGVPDEDPKITFMEALRLFSPYPVLSKEVLVHYVIYSRQNETPRAAWSVYLRGGPRLPVHGAPHLGRSRREVFDAETGKPLSPLTNLPVPILEVRDRTDTTK
jgi:hypothetical protein